MVFVVVVVVVFLIISSLEFDFCIVELIFWLNNNFCAIILFTIEQVNWFTSTMYVMSVIGLESSVTMGN